MYSKFSISDLLSKISLSSDGKFLRIKGFGVLGFAPSDKIDAFVPVLAIRSLSVRSGQEYFVDIECWDGPQLKLGPFTEAAAIAELQKVQALQSEVWALNQRWPLSAARAQMVRQLVVAGGLPDELLGPIGQREFSTGISFENEQARNDWFEVAANYRTVFGVERATFSSGSGYIMLAIDSVILAKPGKEKFDFVALPYTTISNVRLSESNRPGWLKMDIDSAGKRHELAIGWALDPANPSESWSVFADVTLQSADAANFMSSRIYRYILKCWAVNYPIGDDLIGALEKLNTSYEKGTLAPEALATLVDGIVNRDKIGTVITYPLQEVEYK